MSDVIRTTCPYCGVGCGVLAELRDDGTISVRGDPDHPANYGRLCSKGSALAETLSLDDRLLHPLVDGARVTWEAALDRVAETFSKTIAEHGPGSVAIYGSGQLLTEDYYVANKLMKGYIGSANIDTNSRLCMASTVAGHKRAFGSDTVPGCYEDLECADLVVLVGSNLAWCHPVLYQRLAAAREQRGTRVVVIDPRRTATCEIADLHLPIAPDSDVAVFNGLLQAIVGANATDTKFIRQSTSGFKETIAAALTTPIAAIARATGLAQAVLHDFYDLFVHTERVVTVYSQGVNQSTVGTDKVNAIINCHLATGRIGRPGMGPFSVTGQPNAMGGREVGGLANMLAAHMEIADPDHRRIVQAFWKSPRIADKPGLKAVDLFRAVADGRVKAIWILATNPVDSLPEADLVREALAKCPFVVCSDVVRHTDTTAMAHVLLPAAAWGEKSGTVTNSERRISRQRVFLPLPGEARPDWWQLAEVARRMGFAEHFAWTDPRDIFLEHARLSSIENSGTRDFDIGGLSTLDHSGYRDLAPVQWPLRFGAAPRQRLFDDGRFFTLDHRARFVPTPFRRTREMKPKDETLVLNTGRVRDQWHTMTRTGKTPRLMSHTAEPFVEIAPADAQRLGLPPATIAKVSNERGSVLLRVLVTDRQAPGAVFAPMHWTDQFASKGRVDILVAGECDPVSGQPGLKQARVKLEPFPARIYALAVVADKPAVLDAAYWAISRVKAGCLIEMADREAPAPLDALFETLIGNPATARLDVVAYHDAATGQSRFAAFDGEKLVGALFTASEPVAVSRAWAAELVATRWSAAERLRVLAARPGGSQGERGPIVCACLEVGRNQIAAAAGTGHRSVDAVGAVTGAGTNCGSCRAEIARIIHDVGCAKAV